MWFKFLVKKKKKRSPEFPNKQKTADTVNRLSVTTALLFCLLLLALGRGQGGHSVKEPLTSPTAQELPERASVWPPSLAPRQDWWEG